jgi:hypothetical protein
MLEVKESTLSEYSHYHRRSYQSNTVNAYSPDIVIPNPYVHVHLYLLLTRLISVIVSSD